MYAKRYIYNEELTEDQQVEDGIIEEKPSNEEIIKNNEISE